MGLYSPEGYLRLRFGALFSGGLIFGGELIIGILREMIWNLITGLPVANPVINRCSCSSAEKVQLPYHPPVEKRKFCNLPPVCMVCSVYY